MPTSALFRVISAALVCAVPALWIMWPVLNATSAVPGAGDGDNLAALWNVWWFVAGRSHAGWPYWTPLLFAPFGTQLSLHTHATSHSFLAWPWAAYTSVIAAHNLAITAGLALNGVCTFLLALRLTARVLPSITAGILFATSAQVQLRVLGHINLVHAWVLPLFALALTRFVERPSHGRAVLVGVTGAVVAYTDYYFGVFAVLLVGVWTIPAVIGARMVRLPPRRAAGTTLLLVLLALDLAVVFIIAVTGGTRVDIGPLAISLRGLRNPLTILWFLAAACLWRGFPFLISMRWKRRVPGPGTWTQPLTALIVAATLTAPLWLALLDVIASGDYASPKILWRSSPAGGDLLTLFLGHPRHVLTGAWTTAAYAARGIDVMEQSLWLGLVPVVVLVVGWKEWRRAPAARPWILAAVVFAVLSLGPFLRIGGVDTALPLPHALLRYVPLFSNARMPGRAVLMVQLALAMLTAIALARRSPRLCAGVLVLVLLESLPAGVPVHVVPEPDAVDATVRGSEDPGAVAELPIGLRDGFGQVGEFDHRALVHQMHHHRPLGGGFVARLSPNVRRYYLETPILSELLRLSTPASGDAAIAAGAASRASAAGIGFVIINRDRIADAYLSRATLEHAGFRFIQASGGRELYATRAAVQR